MGGISFGSSSTYLQKSEDAAHLQAFKNHFAGVKAHQAPAYKMAAHFGFKEVGWYSGNRFAGLVFSEGDKPKGGKDLWRQRKPSALWAPYLSGPKADKALADEWKAELLKVSPHEYSIGPLMEALGMTEKFDGFLHHVKVQLVKRDSVLLVKGNFKLPGFTEITTSEYEAIQGKTKKDEE